MTEVKTLTHPSGQTFMLGRNKPIVVGPHLRLGNYMLRSLPPPPPSISYIPSARTFLQNILGNDNNGDCTIAAAFHISGMLLQNAVQPLPSEYTTNTAVKLYYALTGGQDTGLDEQLVFNWWQNHGLLSDGTHRTVARVFVKPTDQEQIQTALWLFGNLYLTGGLPDAWVNSMPNGDGFVWDVAGDPNPQNGHAWCGCAYDAVGIEIDTWGLFGKLTYPAIANYCNPSSGGGCYSVVSIDAINIGSQKSPSGFDWTQLQADIASFRV